MWFRNKTIRPEAKIRIRTNVLLLGTEKTLGLDEMLMLKRFYSMPGAPGVGVFANMSSVSEGQLKDIHSAYGESGLFKLIFLATAQNEGDFNHFFEPIIVGLNLLRSVSTEVELKCDNDRLRQCEDLTKFNSNLMLPSLSRKLFNPGRHPGYMVYGLGGPKILVSHPFQGISGEFYEVYDNSVDVVTSLMKRGYVGTFLFLDNLPGLNFEVKGVPAWLLWFSVIAAHSDLVVFVKEYEEEFGRSQRREIDFTPDRVQKKIVEIPHKELTWAKKPDPGNVDSYWYVGSSGTTSREGFYKEEAEHAAPLIEQYASSGFPKDRLILIGESDSLTEYPLDYPVYGSV